MWVIQRNIWQEPKYEEFITLVGKYELAHKIVDVIPFTDEIDQAIDDAAVKFYMGSIALDRIVA